MKLYQKATFVCEFEIISVCCYCYKKSLNCQCANRINSWADLIEHRQSSVFRNLLHHMSSLIDKFRLHEHHWSGRNGCRRWCRWEWWRWDRCNHLIEYGTVWWTEWIIENTRWTLILLIISKTHPICRLILILHMSHCRRQRTNRWCLSIGSGRHAHRLHTCLLLLLQAWMISGDIFVMGQRFLWRVYKMASAKWKKRKKT